MNSRVNPFAAIVLAAGQGTRMRSDLPKVLHTIAGQSMLAHVLDLVAGATRTVVVVGHGAGAVSHLLADRPGCETARQNEQLGTAHAALAARALEGFAGHIFVLFGDSPLIRPETLSRMMDARDQADVVLLGFEAADPTGYGRILVEDGAVTRIVEEKDATVEQRKVRLSNSGAMCVDGAHLFTLLDQIDNDNAKGEYYLTDIAAKARAAGLRVSVVTCAEDETLGVNSRAQLAEAEAAFQTRARAVAMANGVTLTAPETVFFSHDTRLGRDVTVEPNVIFAPGVTVETGARIRAFSHLEACHVGAGAIIGPYARLRPGAEIGGDAHVGNFVEVKNATLGQGAKANHLTYIGDAEIGARANIGAGTITCNYDGVFKHRTLIGEAAFVGSNTALVAPVSVGDGALIAAGSTIVSDVAGGDLALARGRQTAKPGLGAKIMQHLRDLKARKT